MNPEYEELIERYLEGSATAEEVQRVDELVRSDSTARQCSWAPRQWK